MKPKDTPQELASEPIYDTLAAVYLARAYYVVAELGVADLLHKGPMTPTELAEATDTDESSLYRILRACAAHDVFAEDAEGHFEMTPGAEPLRSDVRGSLRDWALLVGSPENWNALAKAVESVKEAKPAFEIARGMPFYDYLHENRDFEAKFIAAMSGWTNWQCSIIAETYDFSGYERIVDVGGGRGSLIMEILWRNAQVQGVLYDSVASLKEAKPRLLAADLANRCETIPGSFFDEVPTVGDLYILKHVLRDWDDEKAGQILNACHAAMSESSKLLIIDGVVDPANETDRIQKLIDLEQMFWLTGRMRTRDEWSSLLAAHGFAIGRMNPTSIVDTAIIEVTK